MKSGSSPGELHFDAPLPTDLDRRLAEAGRRLRARPDVSFAYLFGGLAAGRRTPLSDVDVAVFLTSEADPIEARLEILGELMGALGTERIDLVVLNAAPLSLRGRILASRKLLADNRPFERHAFESLTQREFFDFGVRERRLLRRRYLNG
jgi:predicted nucleotidyltransferase